MLVSRVEMIGFKSFASRTMLEFHPGVMAIVGPNGCGKTNIVDAIRWVLGEQRGGVLRADRMEAVIFNGTANRRPLGMAEVTLTIDNDKGLLPSPYTEVAITRRLFRSGESEYLINRNPSRLREIFDLFTDTGFGHTAYSIIELAMVEGIITGPSEARRKLLEEAAGVAKYKIRRHSAERRLANTRENLARLDDIFSEVLKRYNTLKRQASRARRHQSLTKAIELRLLANLAEERLDLISQRQPYEIKLAELDDEIHTCETGITQKTSELLSLEGQELALLDRNNRTQDTLKRIDRREAEMNGELALAKQRISFLQSEHTRHKDQQTSLKSAINQVEQQRKDTLAEIGNLEQQLENVEKLLSESEEEIEKIKSIYNEMRAKVSDNRKAEETAHTKLTTYKEKTHHREQEEHRLRRRLKDLNNEKEANNSKQKEASTRLIRLNAELKTASDQLKQFRERDKQAGEQVESARRAHSEALTKRAHLAAQVETEKGVLAAHQARSSPALTWSENLRQIVKEEDLHTIAERIECPTEYRKAITAALRPILDAVDRPSKDEALQLASSTIDYHQVILRFPTDRRISITLPELPSGENECLTGPELISNTDEFGEFLRRRLSNYVIVPDRKTLDKLSSWAAERGLCLVTKSGELLEPDGILSAGAVDPDALHIGWTSRHKELQDSLSSAQMKLSSSETAVTETSWNLKESEKNAAEVRKQYQELENRIADTSRNITALEADLKRCDRLANEMDDEKNQIEGILGNIDRPDNTENQLDMLESALKKATAARQKVEDNFSKIEQNRIQSFEKRASTMADRSRTTDRLTNLRETGDRLSRETDSRISDSASVEAKIAEGKTELDRVEQAADNISAQLNLLKREKDEQVESLEHTKNDKNQLKERRDHLNNELIKTRSIQKDSMKSRSEIEAKFIGLRERLREVDRRLHEETNVNPTAIDENTPTNALIELQNLGFSDVNLEKLRARLSALGPVNMLALEELESVEERHKFLKDQKQDLENGIELLEVTIDRINSEARIRFQETFKQVNSNFQNLFRMLFSGGEARIELEGSDPLEADIRVWATPSGKKLQALSMLSGGEKALTAISLLFAIYQVRPSPFCILDEVDAPLDDANVVLFNKLITQFSRDTQFLIVTHNKRTMEAADSLFGVTLGDDGTSHLVSVKIQKTGDNIDSERSDDAKTS